MTPISLYGIVLFIFSSTAIRMFPQVEQTDAGWHFLPNIYNYSILLFIYFYFKYPNDFNANKERTSTDSPV